MDRYTRERLSSICGGPPKERTGHRLSFIPNKTSLGFRLACTCGWSWRSGWVGNLAGIGYAKLDGKRSFETHLKSTKKGHTQHDHTEASKH